MNYEEWVRGVPRELTKDSLWKMEAYRLALFAGDIGWHDVTKLIQDKRTLGLSDQLFRALGSVAANLSEGYSRGSGRDRARFCEYALGSARECRGWYWAGRQTLSEPVAVHRLRLLTQIIRLVLTMIPGQRATTLREDPLPYRVSGEGSNAPEHATSADPANLPHLLAHVPLP
jgi:four helix bundle protein